MDTSGPRALLAHAKYHDSLLNENLRAWDGLGIGKITKHRNESCTNFWATISFDEMPPIQKWGLHFADCIHNLRCALDHLVFGLTVKQIGQPDPRLADRLKFPLCDSRDWLEKAISKSGLGVLPSDILARIESVQPFNRTNPHWPPFLALLRDMNNSAKHRILVPTYIQPYELKFTSFGGIPIGTYFETVLPDGELKNNVEVMRLKFHQPAPGLNFEFQLHFTYTVGHKPGPEGRCQTPMTTLSYELIEEVGKVIAEFE